MWKKLKTIQMILFSTYSLIIILVFTVLVLLFNAWASNLLRSNANATLVSLGQSMQEQIDSEIQKMNDVSLNVMYSNLVKNQFKRYLSYLDISSEERKERPASVFESIESSKELTDILTAAIGPSRPVEQLYLYDFEGNVYGNGFDNSARSYIQADKPWFSKVVEQAGGKYIDRPQSDREMSRYISSREPQYSVSLFRMFYDRYNVPMGIVEVKQYYNRIFKSVNDFVEQRAYMEDVLVYDGDGRLIYPLQEEAGRYAPYMEMLGGEPPAAERSPSIRNPVTGDKELLSVHHSEVTGWNTVVIVSEAALLKPLYAFSKRTVLVAMAILLLAIVLSFAASKKITHPILKIHRAVRGINLEDLGTGKLARQELNSGLHELDHLHLSFVQMSGRLKQSMDDLLLSQSQELQARLVALQSQMNPHFLYNTLATIHAMAEEGMNEQIIAMTENMSDFLRYFSSDESVVPLAQELLHTEKFLEINTIRYGRKLGYTITMAPDLSQLRIPKLIIQPLVENSLKFMTVNEPPWLIRLSGELEGDGWQLTVTDNGPGFSPDSLAQLHGKIAHMKETGVLPVLKLDGMGLLNIYMRLQLSYGARTRFEAYNAPEGGAVITIGAKATREGGAENGQ